MPFKNVASHRSSSWCYLNALQIPRKSSTTGNEFSTHHVNSTNQPTNHRLPIGPSLFGSSDSSSSWSMPEPLISFTTLGRHCMGFFHKGISIWGYHILPESSKNASCFLLCKKKLPLKKKSPEKTQLPNFSHPKFHSNPWIPMFSILPTSSSMAVRGTSVMQGRKISLAQWATLGPSSLWTKSTWRLGKLWVPDGFSSFDSVDEYGGVKN